MAAKQHPTGFSEGRSTEALSWPTAVPSAPASWPSAHPYGIAGERAYGDNGLPVESEMSWASGLTPKGLANATPREGGRYRGTAQASQLRIGVDRDARG